MTTADPGGGATGTDPTRELAGPGQPVLRCLLGMLGIDIHNKGIRTLARLLRDRGVEVIYVGEHNSPEGLAQAAVSEDVDAVGISFSTSSYKGHIEEFMAAMSAIGADDIAVMVGGLIHRDDEPVLRAMGVGAVFGPDSTTDQVLEFLHANRSSLISAAL